MVRLDSRREHALLVPLSRWLSPLLWVLAGGNVALSAVRLAKRWRALAHEPPALPMGRPGSTSAQRPAPFTCPAPQRGGASCTLRLYVY